MSVSIAKGSEFLGVPLLVARNVLRAWAAYENGNVHAIRQRRDVALHHATVAVLIEEFRQRGLIGREDRGLRGFTEHGLTDAGKALAGAKGGKRAPRAKAQAVFDAYLDNCAKLNARSDLPFRIEEIWLFGSMLDEERGDVGDVDFVPVFAPTDTSLDFDAERMQYSILADRLGLASKGGLDGLFLHDRVRSHLTFGGSRNPLLAPNELEQLTDLGVPCRLVFDAKRGGRVSDPILRRHPDSRGRSDKVGQPLMMPRLDAPQGPIEPVDPALAIPVRIDGNDALTDISVGRDLSNDTRDLLESMFVGRPALVSEAIGPDRGKSATMEGLDLTGCDGRSKFGLLIASPAASPYRPDEGPFQCGFVVERSITADGGVTNYRLWITQYADDGDPPTERNLIEAELALHAVMQADVERILRRDAEVGASTRLCIDIGSEAAARQAEEVETLESHLRSDVDPVVRAAVERTGQDAVLELVLEPATDMQAARIAAL